MSFLLTVTRDLLLVVAQNPTILPRLGLTNVLFLIMSIFVVNVYRFALTSPRHVVVKIAGASATQLSTAGRPIHLVLYVQYLVTTKTIANLDLAPAPTVVVITLSFIMDVPRINLNVKFKHSV